MEEILLAPIVEALRPLADVSVESQVMIPYPIVMCPLLLKTLWCVVFRFF